MNAIEVESLSKSYGARLAIGSLSLRVPEGSIYGFLGPNGSGKTTTIRVLLGFLRATGGRASVFGMDCWRDAARVKADVGYLPGDLRLYPAMTCREALRTVGAIRGCDMLSHGLTLADEFALDPRLRARAMSRGTRQKLGLILALTHRPRLLVLDEPTASLDPLMQEQLYRHLRAAAAEGRTVFLSSHTLSEVEQLCSRVAILREGRLMVEEPLESLRERACRSVSLRWPDEGAAKAASAPPHVDITHRNGLTWRGRLTGPTTLFVAWAARQPLEDLTIEKPDLAALFQSYYQ
jgi:ABC-2 type transport system ATP-binding protein